MHVAYLCSRYPDVSHTFIQREVVALRRRGLEISTISVRRARPDQVLSRLDREEWARTYAILPPAPRDHLRAHVRLITHSPLTYARTLARSLRLSPGGFRRTLWRLFYFAEAVVVADRCRALGVEHLHAHFANVGSDVAELAAALAGIGWSFTMHGSTELYDVPGHRLPEKVEDALFVACISDFMRSQLMLWSPPEQWPKLRVTRCGVDTDAFAPTVPGRAGDGPLHVLCVSRLVPGKGLTLLVDAVAALADEGVDLRLTVVGDGPARSALERQASSRKVERHLHLAGAVGQDEMRQLYAAADAFCLPSFAEGVPVVLMEAMATGLPVVATRIAGIPELVEDGESGLLVRPGRPDELADALRRLARSPQLCNSLGAAARARVQREYDLRATSEAVAELFAEMLGEPLSAHSRSRPREPASAEPARSR